MKKIVILFVLICLSFVMTPSIFAFEEDSNDTSNNIGSTVTVQDNFIGNNLIVILDNWASLKSMDSGLSMFESIESIRIECITPGYELVRNQFRGYLSNRPNHFYYYENRIVDLSQFRRIILLHLATACRIIAVNMIRQVEALDGVMYVSPNFIVEREETFSSGDNLSYTSSFAPLSTNRWWQSRINLAAAQQISRGNANIGIGILDSGIYGNHPNLGHIRRHRASITKFFNRTDMDPWIDELNAEGHGTQVAGIIAGNAGMGIAPYLTVASLRVADCCTYRSIDIISAINHAVSTDLRVLNISHSHARSFVATAAIANFPGTVVVSAGNNNHNVDNQYWFLRQDSRDRPRNMIVVGASNQANRRARFGDGNFWGQNNGSNFGRNSVDIFAPGDNINTAGLWCFWDRSWTHYVSGTSFAAPMVAGVVSLMLSVRSDLQPTQIIYHIRNSANRNIAPALQNYSISGGILDAYAAIRRVYAPIPPQLILTTHSPVNTNIIPLGGMASLSVSLSNNQAITSRVNWLGGGCAWVSFIPGNSLQTSMNIRGESEGIIEIAAFYRGLVVRRTFIVGNSFGAFAMFAVNQINGE